MNAHPTWIEKNVEQRHKKYHEFDVSSSAAAGATFEATARSLKGVRAAQEGAARVKQVAEQWGNTTTEQVAGRMAEELHAVTFNMDAAAKGLSQLKASTGAANGAGTAVADISITNAGKMVDQAQVKFHGTAASTNFNIASTKYDGMQRVVPSDQVERVRELAKKRGVDHLGKRNYPEVARSASDRVGSGGVESKPLTRDDALSVAKNPNKTAANLVGRQMAQAVKKGAIVGAAVGGGVSTVANIVAYSSGKKDGKEAVLDTLKDTATSGVSGAVVAGSAVAAEAVLIRVGARALARGSAPVALGLTAVDIARDVGHFAKGDIDGGEFAGRAACSAAKGGCVWGGMEGGAAAGSLICPGIGTIVGGVVGGIGGALFGGWLLG
ncbi:MAG: hypothetical protein HN348_01895 [Proteobacteria bacterium]|jgi:hypothetical protein|nr:hypothetical protein [Pseudomonadota bacterium]